MTENNQTMNSTQAKVNPQNRLVPMEGVENFRDMGGYLTKDGKQVKYGHLYRSSALYYLTEKDKELFRDLGIQVIFDYRDEPEVVKEPDPVLENVQNIRVPANLTNEEIGNEDIMSDEYKKNLKKEGLADFYKEIAFNNPSYKRLFEVALDDEVESLVHHCAAGKDRTGVGAAMLLMALGVPRESIMEDYLLSTEFLPEYIERNTAPVRAHYSSEQFENFRNYFIVKADYLQTFFDSIDAVYKGDDWLFLEKEYQINQFYREKLRKKYLEY